MNAQRFPKGWDEQRIHNLLAELDSRSEDGWIASDEAAALEADEQASDATYETRGGWVVVL